MKVDDEITKAEFRKLYDTVFPTIFKVALRITVNEEAAEDLCQDAFFRLYEKKMVFPSMDDAKYWLIRVVKNASLNYAKRKDKERQLYQKVFREEQRPDDDGESILIRKESREEVRQSLLRLPENLRAVIILKEYADLNYKEIGKMIGISEGNVKVRIFRAREKLSAILAKEGA
jgi:RNA polymerase sigma-70 factor (ECF subfamily)